MSKRVPVDEPVVETFEVSNMGACKCRFMFEPVVAQNYKITFNPTTGIIKKKFAVAIKATLVASCTTVIKDVAHVTCDGVGRPDGIITKFALPIETETKLNAKLDPAEVAQIQ
jgi:hypothetical protein